MLGALGAVVLGGVALAAVQRAGPDAPSRPGPTDPKHAMVVVATRLVAGERFEVRYDSRNAQDSDRLRPSTALALSLTREDKRLYTLVSALGGEAQAIPNGQGFGLPDVDLRGPNSLTYVLPAELDPGDYQLCGAVGFDADGTGQYLRDRFCKTVHVDKPQQAMEPRPSLDRPT